MGMTKLRHYILGTRFLIQTDHIALQSIRGTKELYTERLDRWALTLQEYEPLDVEYSRGDTNANADALSRLPLPDKSETRPRNKGHQYCYGRGYGAQVRPADYYDMTDNMSTRRVLVISMSNSYNNKMRHGGTSTSVSACQRKNASGTTS